MICNAYTHRGEQFTVHVSHLEFQESYHSDSYLVCNILPLFFKIVNIFALDFSPDDEPYSNSYEPELHPGVTYRIEHPKATLKIFSTGSITVTGQYLV